MRLPWVKNEASPREKEKVMRKTIGPAIKAKAVLAALKGEKTIAELSSEYEIHQGLKYRTPAEVYTGISRQLTWCA